MLTELVTETRLGISVAPSDVRLIPGRQDPYKWSFPSEKRYLFQKHLSKHCIQAYKEICAGVEDDKNAFIEAIPLDGGSGQAGHSAMALDAPFERSYDYVSATKPAKSFTARIDELTGRNAELEVELEQWKSAASQAQLQNCELGANLEVAHSNANALQKENERIREDCRQIALRAKFYHTKASQASATIEDMFGAFESAKVKMSASK